jgi:hypothetical protein
VFFQTSAIGYYRGDPEDGLAECEQKPTQEVKAREGMLIQGSGVILTCITGQLPSLCDR